MASEDKDNCDIDSLTISVAALLSCIGKARKPCSRNLNALAEKVRRDMTVKNAMIKGLQKIFQENTDRYKIELELSYKENEDLKSKLEEASHKNFTFEKKWENFIRENEKLKDDVRQLGLKNAAFAEKLQIKTEKATATERKINLSVTEEKNRLGFYITNLEGKNKKYQNRIIEINVKHEREIQEKNRQLYEQKVKHRKVLKTLSRRKDEIITLRERSIESLQQHNKELEIKLESSLPREPRITDLADRNKLLEKQYENLSNDIEIVFESLSDTDIQLEEVLSSLKTKTVSLVRHEVSQQDTMDKLNVNQFSWKVIASSLKDKVERLHRSIGNKDLAMENLKCQGVMNDTKFAETIQKREMKDIYVQVNENINEKLSLMDETKAQMSQMHDVLKHKENEVIQLTTEKFLLEKTIEENENLLQNDMEKSGTVECLEMKNCDLVKELDKMKNDIEEKSGQFENAVRKNTEYEKMITQLREDMNQNLANFQEKEERNNESLTKLRNDLQERDDRNSKLCDEFDRLSQKETYIQKHAMEMEENLNGLKTEIKLKEQKINESQEKFSNIMTEICELKNVNAWLAHELEKNKEKMDKQDAKCYQTWKILEDSDERVSMFEKKNQDMKANLFKRDQRIKNLESQAKELIDTNKYNENNLREKVQQISELNQEIVKSNQEITDLKESVLSLNTELKDKNEKVSLLGDKLKQCTDQLVENKEKSKRMERSMNILEKEANVKDGKFFEMNANLQQNLKQRQEMQTSFENIICKKDKMIHDLKKEIEQRDAKVNALEKMLADKSSGNQTNREENMSSALKKEIRDLKKQLKQTLSKLHDTETELDETKTRLSKAMGDRLTDNNPNITDLSDRNRPTKLAEKCAELYDNQWTDAFENLQKYFQTDETVIEALLHILQATMTFCHSKAIYQVQEVGRTLTFAEKHKTAELSPAMYKLVKDIRKASASSAVGSLLKMYMSHLRQSDDQTLIKALEIKEFTTECLEMCWLMMINDPPVAFAPLLSKGTVFNSDLYKPYTSSGTYVEYVVWPALLLHEGGPVLAKGVAQGFSKSKKKVHVSSSKLKG